MKQVISKIESLIGSNLSLDLTIDENFLLELENYFISSGYESEQYHSTLIALGLLSLYINSHQDIKDDSSHDEVSRLILIGDYFYSLYYEYCANHAFYLIKYNFAKKIKGLEMSIVNHSPSSLMSQIMTFFNEEVPYNELVN